MTRFGGGLLFFFGGEGGMTGLNFLKHTNNDWAVRPKKPPRVISHECEFFS